MMFKLMKLLIICLMIVMVSACRERVAEVSTTDIHQLLQTGDEQYAQVNEYLYVAKSILKEESKEQTYPQYRTAIVEREAFEKAIQEYEGELFSIESIERGPSIEEVRMTSTVDDRSYSFVSGINLFQLNKQTDNGDQLRVLASSYLENNLFYSESTLSNFKQEDAQKMAEEFVRDVLQIDKSIIELYAITAKQLEEQEKLQDKEVEEMVGVLKTVSFKTDFQDGYYVQVTPFIQDLPQFNGDVVDSDSDPTTSAYGAQFNYL